ncbi:hypothetical protein IQ260_18790 [Leptolyngbya cf. ectocarpi LEGE 11479]|uniref:PEP-CTERM sorting domain-containing protein n=1 Tax=Leptolyngbya cf. ectocarpi LEGE 11479 TaxID=1828722 RepID=A0A928ZWF5_LEPEC|nr:hypothetical protein [Leptolyngbya ectocarpi]MBE9068697.1 hypothetical protein [Leptolyngbya cf. ectocarpi LEGE 11479]
MNKLLVSAGVIASSVSLIAAPAQAGTLTFGVEANASLDVNLSPSLAGRTLGGVTLPNSLDVDATNVTGSFTVLDDPAQFTDGDIELNYSLLNDLLGDSYSTTLQSLLGSFGLTSGQALQSVDDIFTITQFTGNGVLTSEAPTLAGDPDNPSPFNILYKGGSSSLLIEGYDTEVAESCLSATCQITGNVSFGVGLVLGELVTLTSDLLANSNITLSPEARSAIASLQQTAAVMQAFGPTLDIAQVVANVSATTQFVEANPNGTLKDIGANVTGGLLTAAATTGGQQQPILSRLLADNPSVDPPAVVDTSVGDPPVGGPTTIPPTTNQDNNTPQDVPEPSILLGLLGTAILVKRSHKKTVVQ